MTLPEPPPTLPLVPGPWLPLTPDERQRFLTHLDRHLRAAGLALPLFSQQCPVHSLHASALSFYDGWALVAGECVMHDGLVANFDALLGPGFIWCMDGSSPLLHALNAGGARRATADAGSDRQQVCDVPSPLRTLEPGRAGSDYLRFFCNALRAEAGCFRLIEHIDQLAACGAEGDLEASVAAQIRPVRLAWSRIKRTASAPPPTASRQLSGSATVLYDGTLFDACFQIEPRGMVTLTKHTPLASDVAPRERTHGWLRNIRAAPADTTRR